MSSEPRRAKKATGAVPDSAAPDQADKDASAVSPHATDVHAAAAAALPLEAPFTPHAPSAAPSPLRDVTLRDVFLAEARGEADVSPVSKRLPIQFDPSSWLHDRALRGCSPAARGIWMDLLCLMHASPVYGKLLGPSGDPYRYTDLASILMIDRRTVKATMDELLQRGVYDIDPEVGVPVSRRMRRDLARSVHDARLADDHAALSRVASPHSIRPAARRADGKTVQGDPAMMKTTRRSQPAGQFDLFGSTPTVEDFVRNAAPEAQEVLAEGDGDVARRYFEEARADISDDGVSGGAGAARSTCPVEALLKAYNEHAGLAEVRVKQFMRNSQRVARMVRRWNDQFGRHTGSVLLPYYATVHAGVEAWTHLFKLVAGLGGLHGEFGGWKADLDWIIGRENFDKLLYNPDRYRGRAPNGDRVGAAQGGAIEAFIAAYPPERVGHRGELAGTWMSLSLDAKAEQVMAGLQAWKHSSNWREEGGRYIPSARRFLAEGRFMDAPAPAEADSVPAAIQDSAKRAAATIAMRRTLRLGAHPDESNDWRVIRFEWTEAASGGRFKLAYLVSENAVVVESTPGGVTADPRAIHHLKSYGPRARFGFSLVDKLHPHVRRRAELAVAKCMGGQAGVVPPPTATEETSILAWADQVLPNAGYTHAGVNAL